MTARPSLFNVTHQDKDGNTLNVGDRVGFIMRGWFLPREQESFGIITEIDTRGGIRIQVIENYKHFTTSGRLACRETHIYFIHHVYDPSQKARVYHKAVHDHEYALYRVDPDDVEKKLAHAREVDRQIEEELHPKLETVDIVHSVRKK
ncbi:MAG: hypothetical protein JNJ49_11600 [Bdellovibrionaceae bacterium]|nr:hypothetical protein [Pseudobdellovibrionaceae bacterium]